MANDSNLVSIIMPVKNAGSYLHEGLSSIRGQTFTFWELIAINDHSTDESLRILEEAARKDHRIRVMPNKGKGIIPALQLALKHCKGAFITRMDADDIMPENRLEIMRQAVQKVTDKSIVTGKARYFGNQPISAGYQRYEGWLNERIDRQDHWDWVYRECVIASPNWMLRKADLLEMGGFDGLTYPEDYHLVLKWYEQGFDLICLPEVTLHWREHPARTSRNSDHYDQRHFFKLKLTHFIHHQLGGHQLVLWGTGPKGKLAAEIIASQQIDFAWMDLLPKAESRTIGTQAIQDFRSIEGLNHFKLLIAVYPPNKEKIELEAYLAEQGLTMGTDFWFL